MEKFVYCVWELQLIWAWGFFAFKFRLFNDIVAE